MNTIKSMLREMLEELHDDTDRRGLSEETKLPRDLKSQLGSWSDTVNHFRSLDKGFELGFSDKVSKKDIVNKLKVKDYMVDEIGTSRFFISD